MAYQGPQSDEPQVPLTLRDLLGILEWRAELLGALLVLAESIIIYLIAGVFLSVGEAYRAYPFWAIAAVMLIAYLVSRLLDVGRVWSPDYEIILTVAIVFTLLLAFKTASFPDYAIYDPQWLVEAANSLAFLPADALRSVWSSLIIVVYAWWRGRTRDEPGIDSAYSTLRWGTLALGASIIFVLISAPEGSEVVDRLGIATLGYFGFVLGAVGLARMRNEGSSVEAPLGARWLATFVVPILVIGLIAVLGAAIFSRQFLDTLLWLMTPLLWVLSLVFEVLIFIIAILAYIILTPIFWLIGDQEFFSTNQPVATPTQTEGIPEQQVDSLFQLPDPLRYLIAAIFLVLVISLLIRFIYRRRNRQQVSADEERESVFEWSDVIGSLGGRFRGIFNREGAEDPFGVLRGDARWRYTLMIREHYRKLQELGERIHQPRGAAETSEEYRPHIGSAFTEPSEGRRAVDEMTTIYRAARYSAEPATEAEAQRMADQWKAAEQAAPKDVD